MRHELNTYIYEYKLGSLQCLSTTTHTNLHFNTYLIRRTSGRGLGSQSTPSDIRKRKVHQKILSLILQGITKVRRKLGNFLTRDLF